MFTAVVLLVFVFVIWCLWHFKLIYFYNIHIFCLYTSIDYDDGLIVYS